jgi:hypothetical protein
MDFYALTMSITRRLVQSAIFFAMTRLHGLRAMGRERGKFVRTRDVRAALDVLNMKHGRAGFFVDVARRNCLAITDKVDGEEQPRVISYDEAHEILQTEENSESESESDQDGISSELERDDGQSESDSMLSEFTSDLSSLPRTESYEIPLDPEEEDANLLDLEISRREETKLWRLLEQPVPSRLRVQLIPENKNEKDILVHRPPRECTSPEDYNPTDRDWRDRTLYCSDWEVYADGTQELEDDLNENRRKRCWTMYEEKISEEEESPRKKTALDVITIDDSAKEDAGVGTVVDEGLDEMSEDRMDVHERSHIPSVVKPRYGSAE